MKKILFFVLGVTIFLTTACSNSKIEYTADEVNYLDTMNAAINQLNNYLPKFQIALDERKSSKKTEDNARDVFAGGLALSTIKSVLRTVTPPERFQEVHEEFLKGLGLVDEVSVALSTETGNEEEQAKFDEGNNLINQSSQKILDAYEEAADSSR
ncbi:hypothetical protein ACFSR7_34440 [Cohnella sp. GCM10020058]|uniref:hypothetical protein n=1 Tax=Cohnella sp. GCM10020058 TaxID=3317330 RepID=UPI003636418E